MTEITDLNVIAMNPAPSLSSADVLACLEAEFGLRGELLSLVSERDQNFRLSASDGSRYVVKIVNADEADQVTRFQIAALNHLQSKGVAGTPRVIRCSSGAELGHIRSPAGSSYRIRVVSFVDGELLQDVTMTARIAASFGAQLARLDEALRTFRHAGEDQRLLWDTQRAMQLLPRTCHIQDRAIRAQVRLQFESFDDVCRPRLEQLPPQVIHNDANPENVLLNDQHEVAGFIDFGDMLLSRRIVEVSTAASYLRSLDGDPLQFIVPFVAAYHQQHRLSRDELRLLFDLIRTRLCMTITMLYWRLAQRGIEDPYARKQAASEDAASAFLARLTRVGKREFQRQLC